MFSLTQITDKYLGVAQAMKAYEDHHYQLWLDHVDAVLAGLMKRSVLTKAEPPPPPPTEEDGSPTTSPHSSPVKSHHMMQVTSSDGTCLPILYKCTHKRVLIMPIHNMYVCTYINVYGFVHMYIRTYVQHVQRTYVICVLQQTYVLYICTYVL